GSGRAAGGAQPAWLDRGTVDLSAFPAAARSEGERCLAGPGLRRGGRGDLVEVVAIGSVTLAAARHESKPRMPTRVASRPGSRSNASGRRHRRADAQGPGRSAPGAARGRGTRDDG